MNIQITDQNKYKFVRKVWNYGAQMVTDDRVDGHLSIIVQENGEEFTIAKFGITSNVSLQEQYGFKFVIHEENIDNNKYYFK